MKKKSVHSKSRHFSSSRIPYHSVSSHSYPFFRRRVIQITPSCIFFVFLSTKSPTLLFQFTTTLSNECKSHFHFYILSFYNTRISLHFLKICIKCLSGQTFWLSFHYTNTLSVRHVMDQITLHTGIPPEQQRLICKGQVLHDGLYLHEHGLGPPPDVSFYFPIPPIMMFLNLKLSGGARTCSGKFSAYLSEISRPRYRISSHGKKCLETSSSADGHRDRFLRIMSGNFKTRAEKKFFRSFHPFRRRDPVFVVSKNVSRFKILDPRSLYITLNKNH